MWVIFFIELKNKYKYKFVDNVITNAESAPAGTFTSNEGAQLCLNPMYIEDNLKKVETFCDFEKDSNGLELDKQMKSSPLVNQMEPSMEVFVCKNMKNQIVSLILGYV